MNKDKIKIILLCILLTTFFSISYQKWAFRYIKTPKTQLSAVDKKSIREFVKNAQDKESISNQIARFFNLDITDLENERSYYENWKKQHHINKKDFYKKTEERTDYIILPLLHLYDNSNMSSFAPLTDTLSDEASYQIGREKVMYAIQSAYYLGGNHTIFDSEKINQVAQKFNAQVVYTLFKENRIPGTNKIDGILSVISVDSTGKIIKQQTVTRTFDNDAANVSERIKLLLNENKESIIKAILKKEFKNIKDYYADFFRQVRTSLKICNSTKFGKWELTEKERHGKLIDPLNYDLIVLPVQEADPLNDRVGRIMASRLVVDEIERVTNKKVMSPELVLRILGRNQILFNIDDINKLAERISADIVYLLKRKGKYRYKNNDHLRQNFQLY